MSTATNFQIRWVQIQSLNSNLNFEFEFWELNSSLSTLLDRDHTVISVKQGRIQMGFRPRWIMWVRYNTHLLHRNYARPQTIMTQAGQDDSAHWSTIRRNFLHLWTCHTSHRPAFEGLHVSWSVLFRHCHYHGPTLGFCILHSSPLLSVPWLYHKRSTPQRP